MKTRADEKQGSRGCRGIHLGSQSGQGLGRETREFGRSLLRSSWSSEQGLKAEINVALWRRWERRRKWGDKLKWKHVGDIEEM